MKRSKSMHQSAGSSSLNVGIKRNPKIKYVKAEVFRKHEKIRDQQFEDKLCQLMSCSGEKEAQEQKDCEMGTSDANFQRNVLENSREFGSLSESDEEDPAPNETGELILAQNYGSFDEEDHLGSNFSSMQGESLPGDFDLEVVGSKIDIPKMDGEANMIENSGKSNNVSQKGSKITFGEPSGDVFGLVFENQYNGIFENDNPHEFLPVNTLHPDN